MTEQRINLEAGRTPRPLERLRDALVERGWRLSGSRGSEDRWRHPDSPGEELAIETYQTSPDYAARYDAAMARLGLTVEPERGVLRHVHDRYTVRFDDGLDRYVDDVAAIDHRTEGWVTFYDQTGAAALHAPEASVLWIAADGRSDQDDPPTITEAHQVHGKPGEALYCGPGCAGPVPHLAGGVYWWPPEQAETIRRLRESVSRSNNRSAVSRITGLPPERLAELGGVPEGWG